MHNPKKHSTHYFIFDVAVSNVYFSEVPLPTSTIAFTSGREKTAFSHFAIFSSEIVLLRRYLYQWIFVNRMSALQSSIKHPTLK